MGLGQISAQENEMGTPFIGKTYSQQNAGRNNLLYLQQANLQDQLMDFEKTFFALENAVAQNPQSALAYLKRAQFKQRFGMLSEAQTDYKMATRLNPFAGDLFSFNNPYSVLNVISYQPEEAVIALDNAKRLEDYWNLIDDKHNDIDNDPILLDQVEAVVFLIQEGQEEVAFLKLDSIAMEYPRSAILYDLMGMLHIRNGEFENARMMLQKALDLEPNFAIAWYNLSRVEKDLGNLSLAKQYLDTAIALQENLSKAYFDRALILKTQGHNNEAIEDYNTIISQKGNNYIDAYLNRGLTRKMLGDFDLALNDINIAIEAYPEYAELYKNRGNLYLLFGYHNRAVEDYTIAIQKRPDYAEAIYNRGLVHFILFDRVSGCADLNNSADLGYAPATEKLKYFCVD
jgi:tetratricopeptide (TPR) repeat protein